MRSETEGGRREVREGGREGGRKGGREGMRWYTPTLSTGERWSYLSSVPARMYLPLGENLTNETGGFSSSEGRRERGGAVSRVTQTPEHRLNSTLCSLKGHSLSVSGTD